MRVHELPDLCACQSAARVIRARIWVGRLLAALHGRRDGIEEDERACPRIRLSLDFRRKRPADDAERLIWRELLKAGTSVGANASESGGAQSDSDFIAKFQIALKEGKESRFWLRLLKHASPDRGLPVDALIRECDEIVSILVTSLRTAKANAAARRAQAKQNREMQRRRS
jgi:four helix bundle protein